MSNNFNQPSDQVFYGISNHAIRRINGVSPFGALPTSKFPLSVDLHESIGVREWSETDLLVDLVCITGNEE